MTITIEEGKTYRSRGGQQVGPMKRNDAHPTYWSAHLGGTIRLFQDNGRHGDDNAAPDDRAISNNPDFDLVAEWCDAQQAVEGAREPAAPIKRREPDSLERIEAEMEAEMEAEIAAEEAERVLGNAPPDIKIEIADTAKNIVSGARRKAYGTPEQNFDRIARFWQAYFENTGRGDVKITARDVSPLMRLMKEARLAETPDHYDSFVDLVGYTLTGAEVNQVAPAKTAA